VNDPGSNVNVCLCLKTINRSRISSDQAPLVAALRVDIITGQGVPDQIQFRDRRGISD
jgi:hypothetical protein